MKLRSEFLAKKFEYVYNIKDDKKNHSVTLNKLGEDVQDTQLSALADAMQALVDGTMNTVRTTSTAITFND